MTTTPRPCRHVTGCSLLEAVRFLTIVPVPGLPPATEATIARSMAWFPLAGLAIGGMGVVAGALALWAWGEPLHAVAVVVCWTLVTLGLHLDGVADSCDALFSWRSREQKLRIMQDSRVGTMGALGLVTVILLKVFTLTSLRAAWWPAALLAPAWGRWADIYGIYWFEPARDGGLGRAFHQHVRPHDFVMATLWAATIGMVLCGAAGIFVLLVLLPLTHLIARRMAKSLGGLTGDTYGALAELAEVIVLLFLLAVAHHGLLPAGQDDGTLCSWSYLTGIMRQ